MPAKDSSRIQILAKTSMILPIQGVIFVDRKTLSCIPVGIAYKFFYLARRYTDKPLISKKIRNKECILLNNHRSELARIVVFLKCIDVNLCTSAIICRRSNLDVVELLLDEKNIFLGAGKLGRTVTRCNNRGKRGNDYVSFFLPKENVAVRQYSL
jgi:hypothetical protein